MLTLLRRSAVWLVLTPEQSVALGFRVPFRRARVVDSHAALDAWDRVRSRVREEADRQGLPVYLWASRVGGPRWVVLRVTP